MPTRTTPPPIYFGGAWTLREKRLIAAAVDEATRAGAPSSTPWMCLHVGLGDISYYFAGRLGTDGEMMRSEGAVSLALDILMESKEETEEYW